MPWLEPLKSTTRLSLDGETFASSGATSPASVVASPRAARTSRGARTFAAASRESRPSNSPTAEREATPLTAGSWIEGAATSEATSPSKAIVCLPPLRNRAIDNPLPAHKPLIELLAAEENSTLRQVVARDLPGRYDVPERFRRPLEVNRSLFGVHPLVGAQVPKLSGRPRQALGRFR